MTDMIDLARRICMGEHIPPLKDGPESDEQDEREGRGERMAEETERRARAESEDDCDPMSTQP